MRNKLDLIPDEAERDEAVKNVSRELGLRLDKDILLISGAARMGLKDLLERLWRELHPVARP